MGALWQDIRYGIRSLGRTPTFTLSAVLTLALGIGASTTIFGLFEAVMLRKVPVSEPDQLYFVAHASADATGSGSALLPRSTYRLGSNYPYLERVRALTREFAGVTAYTRSGLKVSVGGPVEVTQGQFVSGNYHAVLRAPMLLGTGFTSEDDKSSERALIAVLSEGYWTRQFGRDPNILGRTIEIDGRQVAIVGVTAAGFHGLEPGARIDITLPIAFKELAEPGFLTMHDTWTSMNIVARLATDVTVEQALPGLDAAFQRYMREPENAQWRGPGSTQFANALLQPAGGGNADLRARYALPLFVLLAMVGVLLVIACVNVANLLLARGSARSKEIAVRLSIGASRGRIVRQLLVESIQLALLGGALGLLLAQVGARGIVQLLATGKYPLLLDVQPNKTVLLFTVLVSLVTGVVFGLAPALGTTGVATTHALKSVGSSDPRGRWHARQVLVAGQIALCVLLVSGAGLLARTLRGLETREGGFARADVLMFTVDTDGTSFAADRLPAFCDDLIARLTSRFSILSGSCSTSVPVDSRGNARPLVVPGGATHTPDESLVFMNRISPDYFSALGIALAEGRAFGTGDSESSERVAVISRSAASFFFGEENPLGRRVHFLGDEERLRTIVGVVEDAFQESLREPPLMTVYTPLTQLAEPESQLIVSVRTRQDPAELAGAVRTEVRALSPAVVVDYIRTMDQQVDGRLVQERVLAILSSSFGLLALLLSCIGLYGVIAYDVARRARDLGIRLALGGQRADVLAHVLRNASVVTAFGVAIGLAAALASTRVLSSLLFGVTPRDPLTLGLAITLIVITTLMASYLPARRASRIEPVVVLKSE